MTDTTPQLENGVDKHKKDPCGMIVHIVVGIPRNDSTKIVDQMKYENAITIGPELTEEALMDQFKAIAQEFVRAKAEMDERLTKTKLIMPEKPTLIM